MSTKKTSTTTNQYDPSSMNTFQMFQPTIGAGLMDYFKNAGKLQNLWFQQAVQQNARVGNRMNSNVLANATTGGWGGGNLPAFLQATLARNSRAVSGMNSNAFLQSLFQTDANKKWALNSMQSYQPLQTGQTNVQKTSGLGTWLPQVLTAGAGLAMAPFTGGASLLNTLPTPSGAGTPTSSGMPVSNFWNGKEG